MFPVFKTLMTSSSLPNTRPTFFYFSGETKRETEIYVSIIPCNRQDGWWSVTFAVRCLRINVTVGIGGGATFKRLKDYERETSTKCQNQTITESERRLYTCNIYLR
jgi:hypothetical protein